MSATSQTQVDRLPIGRSLTASTTDDRTDLAGRLLARRLDMATDGVAPDIAERLRFSRERALARARQAQSVRQRQVAWIGAPWVAVGAGGAAGSLALGPSVHAGIESPRSAGPGWGGRLASLLPLFILVLGFVVIQQTLLEVQIEAAAEVDAALLSDDLPPQAYTDPGFAEFLRRSTR